MTTTYYVNGSTGNDSTGDGSQGNPYLTIAKCADGSGSFVNDNIVIYCAAGTTITANTPTSSPFSTQTNKSLTLRAYGSGARPILTFSNRGFRCLGTGTADYQDVDMYGAATGNGVEARTGGGCRLVNTDIHGFNVSVKCGTGAVYIDGCYIDKPASNGILVDAAADQNIASSVQILNTRCLASSPTQQDLLVLHDGGIGVYSGAIINNVRVEALGGNSVESGIDIQQQFRGTTIKNSTIIGASQWAIVMGSLFKGSTTEFTTKAAMVAYFNREGIIGAPIIYNASGVPQNILNGGHCAWVTADGGNNGLWQLTGNDPTVGASWSGPYTAADMAATPNLIYGNLIRGCVAGVQFQHPGTQFVANAVLDVTGGDWVGGDSSGTGNPCSFYDMGYDCKVEDNIFATTDTKYTPAGGGSPVGSTRSAVYVRALNSHIAARTRATFTGNVIRQRAEHTGPFVQFAATADHGYLVSDYNAWIADSGVSDGTWPEFCNDAGTSRTFTSFKTTNGSSDAHSLWQTPTTAVIDSDSRPSDGSTLIGAGVARSGLSGSIPATDSEGVAVSSPPDIGAFAYVSQATQDAITSTVRRLLRASRAAGSGPVTTAPPPTPTGLAQAAATSSSITMSWSAADTATYYELRYMSGSVAWTTLDPLDDLSASVSSLTPSTGYDFQVRAGNTGGVSDWSATVIGSTTA